jgi:hypothetical protein
MKYYFLGLALVLSIAIVGCSDDDNPTEPNPQPSSDRDLTVSLDGMAPHVGQLMEFRVATGNELISAYVLDPLPSATFDFTVNSSVPDGAHRLDFYADLSGNGSYNAPPADHAWRVDLPSSGDVNVSFSHNTTFTDISEPSVSDSGQEFRLDLTGFGPHVGQLFEAKVVHVSTGRVVGQYRLDEVPNHDFDIEIRDIVQSGEQYNVDFYADLNNNGSYDAPPADHAWRVTQIATTHGLEVTFGHGTNFTDIGF